MRFIPAGAGNTQRFEGVTKFHAVYPRWRGEHMIAIHPMMFATGLSPLARGTPDGNGGFLTEKRFIPAGAGNTTDYESFFRTLPVYPRWRGEHTYLLEDPASAIGLSPLARGTPFQRTAMLSAMRFIPAGAGNTNQKSPPFPIMTVYPRWRGEHEQDWLYPCCFRRFIPAGAGNTGLIEARSVANSVYPRWRGEHTYHDCKYQSISGLSPLARGTPVSARKAPGDGRFIPAGAGNTFTSEYDGRPTTVYPRWRGEHSLRKRSRVVLNGLSPLARGTHIRVYRLPLIRRFIPAGAGNTELAKLALMKDSVYPRWRGEHMIAGTNSEPIHGLSPLARGTLCR